MKRNSFASMRTMLLMECVAKPMGSAEVIAIVSYRSD